LKGGLSFGQIEDVKLCQCGCGQPVKAGNRFIHGHNRPWLGRHRSEEFRKKLSRKMKKLHVRGKLKLPNPPKERKKLICEHCGKTMYRLEREVREHNFCSPKCYWQWLKGKLPKKWSLKKPFREIRKCPVCNQPFVVVGASKDQKYCSRKCYHASPEIRRARLICRLGEKNTSKIPAVKEKIRRARLHQVFPKEDTEPEIIFEQTLKAAGINNYRKHFAVFDICQPDFVFVNEKVAVFIDGDYWHANPKLYRGKTLSTTQLKNINRDRAQNQRLEKVGFTVLRFWESDIRENPNLCLSRLMEVIDGVKVLAPAI
jgi:DNA mismatch endonuclease Vsr